MHPFCLCSLLCPAVGWSWRVSSVLFLTLKVWTFCTSEYYFFTEQYSVSVRFPLLLTLLRSSLVLKSWGAVLPSSHSPKVSGLIVHRPNGLIIYIRGCI